MISFFVYIRKYLMFEFEFQSYLDWAVVMSFSVNCDSHF